jgi:hypothetical protein
MKNKLKDLSIVDLMTLRGYVMQQYNVIKVNKVESSIIDYGAYLNEINEAIDAFLSSFALPKISTD